MEIKAQKSIKLLPICLAGIIAAGIAGCIVGNAVAEKQYKAEKEHEILINRSELALYDKIEGTIYITGHKNPDSDTVGASIAYADLLQKLGYDARPVVLGKINLESQYILEAAQIDVPQKLDDASGKNMILVDHSEYTHSAPGLDKAKIVSIIDHHGVGSVFTGNQLIYDSRPLGSTATIIWIHYRNYGIDIDKQIAIAMMGSILSDTGNLKLNATTYADREAVKALAVIAGISDIDSFYNGMYKAAISYTGMTDEEIYFSDYKEYIAGNKKFSIACARAYDEESAKNLALRMKAIIQTLKASRDMDMALVQIFILNDTGSSNYLVPSDEDAAKVLEQSFGENLKFDEPAYILNPSVSRKVVLVPVFTEALSPKSVD
ncbi:DHH family phosphoesterase [uncultured Treponema sp.]|uniref:DHH family phosphoesterase n=1 Tax=uncultured Treponema sp. TaxID=162155 RepID=UPI0025FB241E|nr:DHH family phosphoesterase [uncultured Treponema sp.]